MIGVKIMSNNIEVTIPATYNLAGTLTLPNVRDKKLPAVLMIAGSGKGDRDGNIKKLKMNLYKDLADFLTEKGFITLRYDKRGTYGSEGNFLEAGLTDLIDDAVDCVNFLKNNPAVAANRVIILGHSEGA